jgi:diaminopimelate epimerase
MGLAPPLTLPLPIAKAHAYGNDFLLAPEEVASVSQSAAARTFTVRDFVRELCHRHHGIGADGLILYTLRADGATMKLWNADGSPSELSGNGLRCLAALVARSQRMAVGASVTIDTGAGVKTLELLGRDGERYTFRGAMGSPEDLRQVSIPVGGEPVQASVLRLGNPQCIVIGPLPDAERFNRLGPALATHATFPAGTNVEFASVEAPDRVRILIWERGVGPTTSSGTGASASAVAAAAHGGAAREVDVIAPGGTQRVEWRQDGVYLTGWAELLLEGGWLKPL